MRSHTALAVSSMATISTILLLLCNLTNASPYPLDLQPQQYSVDAARDIIDRTNEVPDVDSHILSVPADPLRPPPCTFPKWKVSNMKWSNSSNHLDCDSRSKTSATIYNDAKPLCYTGMSKQPPGYSPPAIFSVEIDPLGRCKQSNPGSVPPRRIGDGFIRCGSSAPSLYFKGDSNEPTSTGLFRVNEQFACSEKRGKKGVRVYSAWGEVQFGLVCIHDEFRNATCTSDPPTFEIPLVGWKEGYSGRTVDGLEVFMETGRSVQLVD